MTQRAMFVLLSLLSCLCGYVLQARAQERGQHLTLAEAIETALQHSPILQAAQQEVVMARAGVEQARAGFLPTLDVQEAFSRSDNPLFVYGAKIGQGVLTQEDFTVDLLNNPDETNNFHTTLAMVQPLYNGGKAILEVKRAKLQQQARDRNLDRQRQEVIFAVARSYYGILLAQKNQLVSRAARKTAEATVRLAQDRFETGLVVESDLLSAQVRLASLQEQDIAASHQVALAQAMLNDAM
ncbi:MAG: TolC family protein, partial [Candidatus Binatia bacterium]